MNKDVIYIDVDDDITAIIGKIKESKEKIVALVPPKHVGILQSAINLRLLDRMAKADKKNMVIVTNNQGLMALAASARIPVAKNLQSKPEIADIPALAIDDGDDIIDGSELPIGDHVRSNEKQAKGTAIPVSTRPTRTDAVETLEMEEAPIEPVAAARASKIGKKAVKNTPKIPNFNKFRKRLLLGILGLIVLIAVLVWAFVFAPAATVTITADTTPEQVSGTVKLGGTAATDFKTGIVSSEMQELKKDVTVQFTATGTQDVGEKATGTITVKNCDNPTPFTLNAGTVFTSGSGKKYDSNTSAVVPGLAGSSTTCQRTGAGAGTVTIPVTAEGGGESYNIGASSYSISGVDDSAYVYANGSQMSGGTSKVITVVSDSDIQGALSQITGQNNDPAKKAVEAQFKNGEVVIDSSFTATQGAPVSTPASGAQATDGKATLTVPMTYTVYGFTKSALDTYLTANLTSQIGAAKNQRIYDNGDKKVGFSNFVKADDGSMTVNLTTTGLIGPQIDETAVKNSIKGMVTGTVQTTLGNIDGVQNIDVHYSYFWVNKVPNNINKITIEFKLTNG